MEGIVFSDFLQAGAAGVLTLVIVVLLIFGYKAFEKPAASLEKLADAIKELSNTLSTQHVHLENIENSLERVEAKLDRLREDMIKYQHHRNVGEMNVRN